MNVLPTPNDCFLLLLKQMFPVQNFIFIIKCENKFHKNKHI